MICEHCQTMGCRTCEKPKASYKKGLWSPEEDQKLKDYILRHGHGCWSAVPAKAGLQRNGKSCRLRWINYLRPGLKRGIFSPEEEETVMKLQAVLGNKWSQIAMHLPGRTDNEVKNYWNSYLKKKVVQVEGSNSHALATKTGDRQSPKISRQRPEEFNYRMSGSESLEPLESPSVDSSQSVQHGINHSSTVGAAQPPYPKVLFSDWLSMDHANDQSPNVNSGINCQWDSSSNVQTFRTGSLQVDGSSTGNHFDGFGSNNGIYSQFQPQFEPVGDQTQGGGFCELFSVGEICGSFDTNNDMFY